VRASDAACVDGDGAAQRGGLVRGERADGKVKPHGTTRRSGNRGSRGSSIPSALMSLTSTLQHAPAAIAKRSFTTPRAGCATVTGWRCAHPAALAGVLCPLAQSSLADRLIRIPATQFRTCISGACLLREHRCALPARSLRLPSPQPVRLPAWPSPALAIIHASRSRSTVWSGARGPGSMESSACPHRAAELRRNQRAKKKYRMIKHVRADANCIRKSDQSYFIHAPPRRPPAFGRWETGNHDERPPNPIMPFLNWSGVF
jgi:hypothetical protein